MSFHTIKPRIFVLLSFILSLNLGVLFLAGCAKGFPDDIDENPRTSSILPDTNLDISPIPNAFEQ